MLSDPAAKMSEEAVPKADAAARLPTLAVATIGHVGCGKSSVVAGLTLIAARLPGYEAVYRSVWELDRRGGSPPLLRSSLLSERDAVRRADREIQPPETLTIRGAKEVIGLPSRRIVAVDCPGRRPWLKNVARGLAVADALLLVVSAPESVQSQTEEHLQLARALGLEQVVVFLNKCDEVFDLEWLDLVERDVRESLDRCGFDGDATRILRGAAGQVIAGEDAWEASLRDLLGALETDLEVPARVVEGPPLLYIDRFYRARRPNHRVLVEGRVLRGSIAAGDRLQLRGLGLETGVSVGSIENFNRRIERASAGDQIGMLLYQPDGDLRADRLRVGQAVVDPRAPDVPLLARLEVEITLLGPTLNGRPTPLGDGHDLMCIFGTVLLSGCVFLEGRPPIAAGERGRARIHLRGNAHLEPGMTFALHDGHQGPWDSKEPHKACWGGLVGRGRILAAEPTRPAE